MIAEFDRMAGGRDTAKDLSMSWDSGRYRWVAGTAEDGTMMWRAAANGRRAEICEGPQPSCWTATVHSASGEEVLWAQVSARALAIVACERVLARPSTDVLLRARPADAI